MALWAPDGVVISNHRDFEENPALVSDNAGGAIITWEGNSGGRLVLAQRINADGAVQWRANGVPVCPSALNNQMHPVIVSDGDGGAIISWYGYPNAVSQWDVWAQRIDANGALRWPTLNGIGVAVCTVAGFQANVKLVSDNAGGAILTWQDSHIFAQRLNAGGTPLWAPNGLPVCLADNSQYDPVISSDNAGGAIIAWTDNRSGAYVYAQRVDAGGTAQWATNGVPVCAQATGQLAPVIVSDGAGGAFVAWRDGRNGASDIFAQRLDAGGELQWAPEGVAICSAAGSQYAQAMISDGAGGAIVAWSDERNGMAGLISEDIYAQRISANGVVQWAVNGVAMCTAPAGQTEPAIAGDAQGGAFITWKDYRNNSDPLRTMNTDIYAQRTSGLRGSLTFYHHLPAMPYFQTPFVLAAPGHYPKICADGSSATLISYKVDSAGVAPVSLRIKEDPEGLSPSLYGSFVLEPSLSHPPDSLVFRYNHPQTPPPAAAASRQITLEVVDAVTDVVRKSNPLEIFRAPVLLVHGLWSDPSTFNVMRSRLASQGWPDRLLHLANYAHSHARSFAGNSWEIPLDVHALLALARNGNYSAGRVDVVGHSMGGLLARLYLQGSRYQNNLNRLITLNTPHSGSQAADWLIRKPELGGVLNFFYDVYGGAVADLRVEGPGIRDSLNGSSLNARVTPSHAIITVADPQDASGLGWVDLLWAVAARRYNSPVLDLLGRLYNYRPNDLVVPDLSQQGGLSAFTLVSDHQIHTGATSNTSVINRVIQLLNTSADDVSAFSMAGFDPPLLHYTFDSSMALAKPGRVSHAAGAVAITSPANGTTVRPGQTQPITIAGAGGVTALVCAAGNASVGVYSGRQDSPSATFEYPVPPNAVGLLKVLAMGFTDSGDVAMDSLTLQAVVTADLDSLQAHPAELYLPAGQSKAISVSGAYHDGIVRDLRFESGLSFESGNASIAEIPEPYLIRGMAEGKTTVTVRYQSREYTIPVNILPAEAWTTSVEEGRNQEKNRGIPKEHDLKQNYPNPFNPSTTIRYTLPQAGYVTLKVYNLLGKEIVTLVSGQQTAGEHEVRWHVTGLPSGVYVYMIKTGAFSAQKKLLLLR